jgi:Zn-dependent hydrolases, including glyoxylases
VGGDSWHPYRFRDSARRHRAGRLSDTGPYAGQRCCAGDETELPVHRRCDRKRLRCLDAGAGRNEPGRVLRWSGWSDGVAGEKGRPHEILRRSSHAGVWIDGASGLQSAQPRCSRRSHRPCGSGDPRRKPRTAKQCEAVFERTGPLRVVRPRRNAVLCIADSPKI